jgi:hypothetical protein
MASNWGPQDESHPKPDETIVEEDEEIIVKTIPGHLNITDLFTKKFKSDAIFHKLVNFILSPRLLRRC